MPSPFPGMDPYLEGSTWMNFHGQLCAEIARQLGPKLRPRYLARLTERCFTEIALDDRGARPLSSPDVGVAESAPGTTGVAAVGVVPGDADVMLDLQQALGAVYDLSDYGLEIDYTRPAEVPLAPEQSAWVDQHLRAAGLRD